jgi:hypothetical protein
MGHQMEAIARSAFELKTMRDWRPLVVESEENPRIFCSLDGINENEIIEIKYMGKEAFQRLKEFGEIPEQYYPQIQQQLYVTKCALAILVGINSDEEISSVAIVPNHGYINETILPAINRFLHYIDTKTPPPLLATDKFILNSPVFEGLLMTYQTKKAELESMEKQIIETISKYHNSISCGKFNLKLTKNSFTLKGRDL